MDGFTSLSFSQTVLVWTLLGMLLIWTITFIILAFRTDPTNAVNLEDEPIPIHTLMDITETPLARTHGIASSYQLTTQLSNQLAPMKIENERHSTTGEMGTVAV